MEDIQKLYGAPETAPKTPKDEKVPIDCVDLLTPEHAVGDRTLAPDGKAYRHDHDWADGVMIRKGGREERARMSTPSGAAWQVATFENGDTIDANTCLCYCAVFWCVFP